MHHDLVYFKWMIRDVCFNQMAFLFAFRPNIIKKLVSNGFETIQYAS